MLQEKIIQNDYKIITTKEGLETTNKDLTFIPIMSFKEKALLEIGYSQASFN